MRHFAQRGIPQPDLEHLRMGHGELAEPQGELPKAPDFPEQMRDHAPLERIFNFLGVPLHVIEVALCEG
ncbi:hypothetical protein MW7_007430 [Imbroritus primus]|uniref:Uncharacterized protein n=1 Tax=Imbroritus primus TaxID=3058603 RepID=A0ACD3SQX5_9BURK|nr:hypothetical protein MW7_007430 [Burkholderiaceae bacterium PBA]